VQSLAASEREKIRRPKSSVHQHNRIHSQCPLIAATRAWKTRVAADPDRFKHRADLKSKGEAAKM
jgi:hypothetical protein